MRINISIDNKLLNDFDAYCNEFRYNRSEFISKIIRDVVYNIHTTKTETPIIRQESEHIGWCEVHFEKGVTYPRKLITYEDENGVAVIEKKWACPKCIAKYEEMGKGRVYYL